MEWAWLDGFRRLHLDPWMSWAGNPGEGGRRGGGGGWGWISKDKRGTWKALTKRRLGNAPSNDEPPTRLLVFIGTDGHRLLPLLLPNSPPFSDGH